MYTYYTKQVLKRMCIWVKSMLIRITILATMFLVACNDDKDEVTTAPDSAPTEQDERNQVNPG